MHSSHLQGPVCPGRLDEDSARLSRSFGIPCTFTKHSIPKQRNSPLHLRGNLQTRSNFLCVQSDFTYLLLFPLFIQCVPLATETGISLIILTPMKMLQRKLNRSTFVRSRIWASENPNAMLEDPLHSDKNGVRCGMSRRRIIGPIFFDATITTAAYLEIFHHPCKSLGR